MNPGIYTRDQVPREHYDRLPELNISKLAHINRSPAHFQAAITNAGDEDKDSMIQGRATHLAVFEPELFRSSCVVWEGGRRYGKEWDSFCAKHRDEEILTETMHANAVAIAQAVRNNKDALPYISKGRGELTLVWTHAVQGLGAVPGYEVQCKGRIDFHAEQLGALVDLKTTADASPDAFTRTTLNLHYHVKAAWYQAGYELAGGGKRLPYFIVAAETKAPWAVQVYELTDDWLEPGRTKFREWLDRYNFCRAHKHWPAYAEGPMELPLPYWMQPEEDPTGMGLVIGG